MTVLILAPELDPTVDAVVDELNGRNVPVFRADTAWFPQRLTLGARLDAAQDRWTGSLHTDDRDLELDDVRSVWFRAPTAFALPESLSEPERRHARWEAKLGFGGVLTDLDVLWVNDPSADAAAAYKPRQLRAAAACGLAVPPTLVTNRADDVRAFADEHGPVVVKPFGFGAIDEDDGTGWLFTHVLTDDDLADLRGVATTAHQVQAFVGDKDGEARVTVVGDRAFAAVIRAGTAETIVDWRCDYTALEITPVDVPQPVTDGVERVMRRLGLVFGALDFAIDTDGRWWFLEVNSGGQFGFVESATGLPITEAIADLLQEAIP